ncbi:MAG TPA: adenylyltransferase [Verrucomicrobia bacterium]|nr:MAG: adenylyltransferase [Lentisphaerae bacterium GWF2_57_35]HBA85156.1 adenylyltransferase [Verrucomicrobiota bacterium]
MRLNDDQKQRYARHISLPEIGEPGQKKLLAGRVLIVGAGGLGSPSAFYLAAAGVGAIGLMDADVVDLSNLQRQILHFTADVDRPKVESACDKLQALNPDSRICVYPHRLTAKNAGEILESYDFVIDATDNFDSKFMIADVCHAAKKPYSHAGIMRFCGQTMTVQPGKTACYRCVFQEPPPASDYAPQGPLGAVPGVMGSIQATEAIKFLLGIGDPLVNTLLVYDALEMSFRKIVVKRDKACSLCGDKR